MIRWRFRLASRFQASMVSSDKFEQSIETANPCADCPFCKRYPLPFRHDTARRRAPHAAPVEESRPALDRRSCRSRTCAATVQPDELHHHQRHAIQHPRDARSRPQEPRYRRGVDGRSSAAPLAHDRQRRPDRCRRQYRSDAAEAEEHRQRRALDWLRAESVVRRARPRADSRQCVRGLPARSDRTLRPHRRAAVDREQRSR